jgi:hypothetical protein
MRAKTRHRNIVVSGICAPTYRRFAAITDIIYKIHVSAFSNFADTVN